MRTTVDLDPTVLERAKRLALSERRTLGAVVNDAIAAYVGKRKAVSKDPPFELLARGTPRGRFPSPGEMSAADDDDDMLRLQIPGMKRRASP